jgi:hypothetical protein
MSASMILLTLAIASAQTSLMTESSMEVLIEELIDLHAASPTFRQVFRSRQTTQLFLDAYKTFVNALTRSNGVDRRTTRMLEKISHFSLTLTLANDIAAAQKRDVRL